MNNEFRLVLALRQNDPDAVARLFDAYADHIFRYCWFMLRNRDFALIALRDTLVVAQAHIGRLADPEALESWMYALARAECRRRRPVPPVDADEPATRPQQADADSRLLAWNAVTSMDVDEMEALELSCRHHVDLGMVLGLAEAPACALLARARRSLEDALGAEVLVSRVSHACPDRAQVLRGWAGTVTAELRGRVLRHAEICPVCGPNVPRNVSAARVFALLPTPSLPSHARDRVLAFLTDPRMAAYREFSVGRAAGLEPHPVPHARDIGQVARDRRQDRAAGPGRDSATGAGRDRTAGPGRDSAAGPGRSRKQRRAPEESARTESGPELSGAERSGQTQSGRELSGPEGSGQTQSGRELSGAERSGQTQSGQAQSGREGATGGRAASRRVRFRAGLLGAAGVAAVAAAVAATFALATPGAVPRHAERPTAVQAAGRPVPTRQGPGAEGAVPVNAPTGMPVPRLPVIGPPGIPGQVLVDKVTKPLPTGPVVVRPVPPPAGSQPPPPSGIVVPRPRTLAVSPDVLDLGAGTRATFTITAVGAPSRWTAATSSGQLSLSVSSGVLQPGQSQTIVIVLNRASHGGGSAMIYVSATGVTTQAIAVDWAGNGPRPSPSPTPTPVPTPTPTPTPSPSPSPSGSAPSSASPSPSQTPSPSPSPSFAPSPSRFPSPRP